jgi:hypothetical protein
MEPSPEAWPLSLTIETMDFGPEGLTVRQLRDALRAAGVRPVGRMKVGGGAAARAAVPGGGSDPRLRGAQRHDIAPRHEVAGRYVM